MKKALALFLAVLLILSMTGCSVLAGMSGSTQSEAAATHTPEPTAVPEADTESTTEAETEATAEPTTEPTAEPTPDPAAEKAAATLELYRALFETAFIQSSDTIWELTASELLTADPSTFSPHGTNPLYWMEGFALYDINGDAVPELILESGEVEKSIYIFTIENDKIAFCASSMSGNQEETNYALHVYETVQGETKCLSMGIAGTGAGDAAFAYEITPDLTVTKNFYSYTGMFDSYQIDGEEVDESTYTAAYDAYFEGLTLIEQVPFTSLSSDPLAAFDEAAHG